MADKESKELALFNQMSGDISSLTDDQKRELADFKKQGMAEEQRGLPLTYPRIKILHGGAAAFQFGEGDTVKEFLGIIAHVEVGRQWWAKSFADGGGGQMPDCYSRDLMAPERLAASIQSDKCTSCAKNEWGSEIKQNGQAGRGKACKETRRIFIIPAKHQVPYWMLITPANLKPLSTYLTSLVDAGVKRPQFVATRFQLVNEANADGVKYSSLVLENKGNLPDNLVYYTFEMKKGIEAALKTASPITSADFMDGAEPDKK